MSPYLLLFLSLSLTPALSSPGLAWSEEETLIVKAKLLVVMTSRQSVTKEYLKLHPELGLSSWPETKSMPNAAKMLRLGFHGCLKYSDGTGGCNGCLNNHNMGLENRHNCSKGEDNTMLPNSIRTDNAGLELTADILEEIYTNPNFPKRAQKLPKSLAQSGKSRADLWNFAQAVAVERGINNNNDKCDNVCIICILCIVYAYMFLMSNNLTKLIFHNLSRRNQLDVSICGARSLTVRSRSLNQSNSSLDAQTARPSQG